jgi:hypothetical protein
MVMMQATVELQRVETSGADKQMVMMGAIPAVEIGDEECKVVVTKESASDAQGEQARK